MKNSDICLIYTCVSACHRISVGLSMQIFITHCMEDFFFSFDDIISHYLSK